MTQKLENNRFLTFHYCIKANKLMKLKPLCQINQEIQNDSKNSHNIWKALQQTSL